MKWKQHQAPAAEAEGAAYREVFNITKNCISRGKFGDHLVKDENSTLIHAESDQMKR